MNQKNICAVVFAVFLAQALLSGCVGSKPEIIVTEKTETAEPVLPPEEPEEQITKPPPDTPEVETPKTPESVPVVQPLVLNLAVIGTDIMRDIDGYTALQGKNVLFRAETLSSKITTIRWNFGDGETATDKEPTYTYAEAGDYIVQVSAEDEFDQTANAEIKIKILSPETHWYMWGYKIPVQPVGLKVVILPPAYFSVRAMVQNQSWIGPDATYRHPAVQAAMEAAEYWEWFLAENSQQFTQLSGLSWTIKVAGYNAGPEEVRTADILIAIAMVGDPIPFVKHSGEARWESNPLNSGKPVCITKHEGIGEYQNSQQPVDLRNLVLHEFGHCIGAGHSGAWPETTHCSPRYGCFKNQPDDVMTGHKWNERNCLSNLDLFALAEAYDWREPIKNDKLYDDEVFIPKTSWTSTCIPEGMKRF
ncbi:MAG: PKD domain-containing protein [Candidatus Colwellbacteria bacterium]|nr:PKD domain-containing protein [Candidatus Colwellbacteria bacterium]